MSKLIIILFYRGLSSFLGGAHAIQWFFAAVSIVGFFFALFFLPETHGKKLSEIEEHFKSKSSKARSKVNPKKNTGNVNNRKPAKQTLETVKESEK